MGIHPRMRMPEKRGQMSDKVRFHFPPNFGHTLLFIAAVPEELFMEGPSTLPCFCACVKLGVLYYGDFAVSFFLSMENSEYFSDYIHVIYITYKLIYSL
jgi:hypothetical protein